MSYEYTGKDGEFKLKDANRWSYLYFPDGAPSGMMGSLTPEFGGDLKTSQNTFILEPVSSDNLHNNRSTRNFWLKLENGPLVSCMGASSRQHALEATTGEDEATLYGGMLFQKVERKLGRSGLRCEVTTFVPVNTDDQIELTKVTVTNTSDEPVTFTATAAAPIYGRSADNIRDHRNVTSMLNRVRTTKYGVVNFPTLTFDERGHRMNEVEYGFFCAEQEGIEPVAFCPVLEDFMAQLKQHEDLILLTHLNMYVDVLLMLQDKALTASRPWVPRCSSRRRSSPEEESSMSWLLSSACLIRPRTRR